MLKFGGDFRFYRKNFYRLGNATPRFTFGTTSQWAARQQPSFTRWIGQDSQRFTGHADHRHHRPEWFSYAVQSSYGGLYFQDAWRVTPKLTLTLGVRYEFVGAMTERFNRTVRGFDPSASLNITPQAEANYAARPTPLLPVSAFHVAGGLTYAGANNQPREVFPST